MLGGRGESGSDREGADFMGVRIDVKSKPNHAYLRGRAAFVKAADRRSDITGISTALLLV